MAQLAVQPPRLVRPYTSREWLADLRVSDLVYLQFKWLAAALIVFTLPIILVIAFTMFVGGLRGFLH